MALTSLASGAIPAASFPNSHLLVSHVAPEGAASPGWAAPVKSTPLSALRKAVCEEDWAANYSERKTKIHMRAEWSASPERCALLQSLVHMSRAQRVLEIGSFCGVGTLALAEALPAKGEVLALELDSFVVSFGKPFQVLSSSCCKIKHSVGPALPNLEKLALEAGAGKTQPFDVVVVDADKERMNKYFELLWKTPGLLSDGAIVCVDLTPFKGQPPLRYLKYGFPYRCEADSGQKEIDTLLASVKASPKLSSYEFCNLLIVQQVQDQ